MSKIVVVGTNHAGTACINTMLDNFGHENEIVVFDQNSNISFPWLWNGALDRGTN